MVKPLGAVDGYLKFVQQHFNTDNNYGTIVRNLEEVSETLRQEQDKRKENRLGVIEDLIRRKNEINLLKDEKLFGRVVDITSKLQIEGTGINSVLRMSDKLIYDIDNTRQWLAEYENVLKNLEFNSMEKLITLGKAILGRAIELCPIDTGTLRASGTMMVFDGYIIISFAAPYATYVHENLEVEHNVGRAKFLEVAVQEFLPNKSTWIETHEDKAVLVKIGIDNSVIYRHNTIGKW